MSEVVQQVVNGLSLGSTYALLALGLAMVFTIMHLINFAHGELITLPGYAMYALYELGAPWALYAPVAILVGIAAALAMERLAFRPVRHADASTMLLTSIGLSIIIQGMLQTFVSPRERTVGQPDWLQSSVELVGIRIQTVHLVTFAVAFGALLLLGLMLRSTVLGLSMRAAAEDFAAARLMGVRANAVIAAAFAVSGALAGLASVLILARRGNVQPTMGLGPVLAAFVATVLGGIGSLGGAVMGGFALGFAQVAFRAWLPSGVAGFTEGLVFAVVGIVLFFRPTGLFGVQEIERA